MPIYRRIDEIDKAFLQSLVDEEVMEDRGLEYKRDLNILIDLPKDVMEREKQEFCGDVSAFANTDGGFLIYGIDQDVEGRANELNGISCLDNFDKLRNRLFQIIGAGIEPQLYGVEIEKVELDEEKIIILVQAQPSWSKPHWVGKKGCRTFCTRTSSGKDHLDIRNVRELFVLSETAGERIRQFRNSRISAIKDSELPVALISGPTVVLHVIPFSAVTTNMQFDLSTLKHMHGNGKYHQYFRLSYNFEGLYEGSNEIEGMHFYQVFRNGSLEFVTSLPPHLDDEIFAPHIGNSVTEMFLPRIFEWYDKIEVSPPMYYFLSVLHVRDQTLTMRTIRGTRISLGFVDTSEIHPITDKDQLLTAGVRIESHERDVAKLMRLLRPSLDAIWQASGWPNAKGYDDDGDGDWIGYNHIYR